MQKMLIQPTETATWHALINEATAYSRISLETDLECYLVFLLMKFNEKPEFAESILGLEFLTAAKTCSSRPLLLREVGDKCLLHAGLFPEYAHKRRVTPNYFIKLGRTAYATLSCHIETCDRDLYHTLCGYFIPMMSVLSATREIAIQNNIFRPPVQILSCAKTPH